MWLVLIVCVVIVYIVIIFVIAGLAVTISAGTTLIARALFTPFLLRLLYRISLRMTGSTITSIQEPIRLVQNHDPNIPQIQLVGMITFETLYETEGSTDQNIAPLFPRRHRIHIGFGKERAFQPTDLALAKTLDFPMKL